MKRLAYLVGPFLGELCWEYTYFAPYIITLMKREPKRVFIIFTRSSSFDLYGSYADIFVPLKIINDKPEYRNKFSIDGFVLADFNMLLRTYISKYKKRYRILDKIYPDISRFNYKVKWQYPRSEMDYNFQPRKKNKTITDRFVKDYHVFVDHSNLYVDPIKLDNYETKHSADLAAQVTKISDNITSSMLGCFIEALKTCQFVIGNLSSDTSRLALLLKKPLIVLNEQLTDDEIHLINPLNTPVIRCKNIKEGLKTYEDYFRPAECGAG